MKQEIQLIHDRMHREAALAALAQRHPEEFQKLLTEASSDCETTCAEVLRHFRSEPASR
jgi:hypothetical protein